MNNIVFLHEHCWMYDHLTKLDIVLVQILCCPQNPGLVTIIGVGIARTFKVSETQLRPVSTDVGKKEEETFLCHMWLAVKKDDEDELESDKDSSEKQKDGTCIYAVESGAIMLVDGGEVGLTSN